MDTRILENEVKIALKCIEKGVNFILEGGAGSGKTYSLISLIETLIIKSSEIKIVCITYTNNAVAEILSRIENKNLRVSTIHDFIWSLIGKYQNEIKNVLIDLINDEGEKSFKNSLNSQNSSILGPDNNKKVDMFFLNYNWGSAGLASSVRMAKQLPRNSYDIFAGFDIQKDDIEMRWESRISVCVRAFYLLILGVAKRMRGASNNVLVNLRSKR